MISHRYKCIFVEIPKTGSSSIRALIGKSPKPHLDLSEIRKLLETGWTPLDTASHRFLEYLYLFRSRKGRIRIGRKQFAEYFKFGFVRNPWDRVVSLYERTEPLRMKDKLSFEQFVDWIQFASSTCIHSSPHRYQLDWFVDGSGNVLADFIGRFERLETDWGTIAQRLGITETLPHKRENPRARHYTEYYNDKTREIIASKFKIDIDYFGYEFGT
jgi:Sulfotransferase family